MTNRAFAMRFNLADPERQKQFYDGNRVMPSMAYPAVEGIKNVMQRYDSHGMRCYMPECFYDVSPVQELDPSGSAR